MNIRFNKEEIFKGIKKIGKKIRRFERNNYSNGPCRFPGVTIESLRIASGEKPEEKKYLILFKSVHPRLTDMSYKKTIVRMQELSVSKKVFEKFQNRFDDDEKDAWLYPKWTTVTNAGEFVSNGITEKEVSLTHYNRLKSLQIARHERSNNPEDPELKKAHIAYLEHNARDRKLKAV